MVKMLGLDALPESEQQEALIKIGEIIFQRVVMRGIEMLSEDEKMELDEKADDMKKDPAALFEFFESKIANFKDVVKEEIEAFKNKSVDMTKNIG